MSKATHHNLNSSEMQNVTLQELADFEGDKVQRYNSELVDISRLSVFDIMVLP